MNPLAILALLGDLYEQLSILKAENAELRGRLAKNPTESDGA